MPQTQGDRIEAGTATPNGLITDSVDIPKELRHPATTPSTQVAGEMGAKYGDVKTAKTGGVIDALQAVFSPSRASHYRAVYNSRKESNGEKK